MIFAIDFDGTLVDGPKAQGETLTWLDGAREALDALLDADHDVIIHSCRSNPEVCPEWMLRQMKTFLDASGHLARPNLRITRLGEGKPCADYYIDDRAIRLNAIGVPGAGLTWAQIAHHFGG